MDSEASSQSYSGQEGLDLSQLPASQNAKQADPLQVKEWLLSWTVIILPRSLTSMDMHKVVTQFVQIAALKTVEALTRDLKNQTHQKMEKLFSSIISWCSGYLEVFKFQKTSWAHLTELLFSFTSLLSPSQELFGNSLWVGFGFAVSSILCDKFLVGLFSPSRFLPQNSLLDPFWPTPLNITPSQLLIFSLKVA